jgi:hypothetical protein
VVVHRHRIKDTVTVTNMAGLSGDSATNETLNGTGLIDQNTVSAEAHTERAHRVVERKVVRHGNFNAVDFTNEVRRQVTE